MTTVLQRFNPSGKPSNFPNQQPLGVSTFPPYAMTSNKTFHIPSSVPSEHPSGSPSVTVGAHPSLLPSIEPTKLY